MLETTHFNKFWSDHHGGWTCSLWILASQEDRAGRGDRWQDTAKDRQRHTWDWDTAAVCCCGTWMYYRMLTATSVKTTARIPEDPHCHQEESQEDPGCWWERKKRKRLLIIKKRYQSNIYVVLPLSRSKIHQHLLGVHQRRQGQEALQDLQSPGRGIEFKHQHCSNHSLTATPLHNISILTKKSYHLLVWFYCCCPALGLIE